MEQKQLWMIIIVAAITAVIVSFAVVAFNSEPELAPKFSKDSGENLSLPDLIVSDIDPHTLGCGGGGGGNSSGNTTCTVEFSITVQNIGNANAGASRTKFEVLGESSEEIATSPILAGNYTILYTAVNNLILNTSYTAIATADSGNQIRESNENNNQRIEVFWV